MKFAVIRLIGISLASLLLLVMAIASLNFLGGQQVFSPLDHPLLNIQEPLFLVEPRQETISLPTSPAKMLPYLNVTTNNDKWILKPETGTTQAPPIFLADYLEGHKITAVALFVHTRINLGALVKIFFDKGIQESVIIFANEQKIQIELKKLAPRWLYVANPSQAMRLKVMDSFWLSPMASFEFDFIVSDPRKEAALSPSLIRELKKRYKRIILPIQQWSPQKAFTDYSFWMPKN